MDSDAGSAIQGEFDDGFHAGFEVEGEAGRDGNLDDQGVVVDIGVLGVCGRLGAGAALRGVAVLGRAVLVVSALAGICRTVVGGTGIIGTAGIGVVIDAESLVGFLLGGFIGCGFVSGRFDVLDGALELVAVDLIGGELAEAELLALVGLDLGFDPDVVGVADICNGLAGRYDGTFHDVGGIVDGAGNRGDDVGLLSVLLGVVECSLGLAELELGVLHGLGVRRLRRRLVRHGRRGGGRSA